MTVDEPRLIEGGLHIDERGELAFVNPFQFEGIRRFYTIETYSAGIVRAWHGHKVEAKYFFAVAGTLLVCCVAIDDWKNPSRDLPVRRFVLSANRPAILHVPGGHANGLMSLTDRSKAIVFSTATLKESESDDFRFPAGLWDPWSLQER